MLSLQLQPRPPPLLALLPFLISAPRPHLYHHLHLRRLPHYANIVGARIDLPRSRSCASSLFTVDGHGGRRSRYRDGRRLRAYRRASAGLKTVRCRSCNRTTTGAAEDVVAAAWMSGRVSKSMREGALGRNDEITRPGFALMMLNSSIPISAVLYST